EPARAAASGAGPSASACFFGGALVLGIIATGMILFVLAGFAEDRLFGSQLELSKGLRREGASDIVALGLALFFWRLSSRDRLQPLLALGLAILLVAWLSMMIRGPLLGDSAEAIIPREGWLPEWWTWTLNLQAGLACVLVVVVWLNDRAWRRMRSEAWPDRLERLMQPYPRWPGVRE